MSGESPGCGHSGWGSSPGKVQAPRPILGNNSQTLHTMDKHPQVPLEGRNVQNVVSPSAAGSKDEKKVLEVKKGTLPSKSMAAGVQSTPPAGRQRRTSLEKQTMQENLQQPVLMRSDRTRYGSGNSAKVVNTTDEPRGNTAGRLHGATSAVTRKNQGPNPQSGDSDPAAVTMAVPIRMSPKEQSPVHGPSRGTPVGSHPVSTLPTRPTNTQRAPELCLAEQIPALVKRLETLKKTKLQLQKQIDCVYKLKAANPNNQAVHDKKLSSLAVQLAETVQDMEAVLEQMGPVAESFRNQQRFERYEERPAPKPSPSNAKPKSPTCPDDTQQACVRPVLRPASFPFEKGDLYRQVGESVQQQQRPAETPQKVPEVPAVCIVKQDYGLKQEGNSTVAVQSPPALGGSREQQDCGLIQEGQNDEKILVTTKYGQLRGVVVPVKETSRVIDAFFGVPFAKPPVGSLRFANPEPPEPWSSVRDASEFPPMCLQMEDYMKDIVKYYQSSFKMPRTSEDCLYLNVFTPADRDIKSKLPVMVFIHGGALVLGAASMYDGSALSAYENVVVVSVQYRLGILGFFSTGDEQLPGNYGLLDQVAALRWVQENIADFGGDPTSVTIFGESAGAISVSSLVLSPLAKGLFHRAIAESGAVTMPSFVVSNSEELLYYQNIVTKTSGCDFASIADCLRKKSEEELLAIVNEMGMLFLPACVDGVFLPKPVKEIMANKEGNKVPLLIGINNHELGWVALPLMNITGITEGMTRETMRLKLQNHILGLSPDVIPLAVDEYLGDTTDPLEIRDRFLDLCGDVMFVMPAFNIAKYHRDMGLPVYLYEFQHPPSLLAHVRPDYVKADHGDELISVLGGPFLRDGVIFAGPATPEEKVLTRKVMKYWANFARTGNPNSPDLTTWPQYGADKHYMEINLQQKSSSNLKEDKFKFWTEILPEKIRSQRAE